MRKSRSCTRSALARKSRLLLFRRKSLPLSYAPGRARTCNPMIRSHILYPIELRVRWEEGSNHDTKARNGNSRSPEATGVHRPAFAGKAGFGV